jgi:hypothetical protein
MIDNLAVLFSCTTVIWVVVRLVMLDREKKRAARAKSDNRGY